ncbi:MAG: ATP-binding protein [Myxococcota bacterium]
MRALLEALPSRAALVGPDGGVLASNAAWRSGPRAAPADGAEWMRPLSDEAKNRLRRLLDGQGPPLELSWTDGPLERRLRVAHLGPDQGGALVTEEATGAPDEITQRLHRSEGLLEAIVGKTPNIAIQTYDRAGRVLSWNQASERLYGWTKEEAVGQGLESLIFTEEEAQRFRELLEELAQSGGSTEPTTWPFRGKNGRSGYAYSTTFAAPIATGEVQFVCMDVDVTELRLGEAERKNLSAQLLQSQKMEGIVRFAGGIAHDFNNLLTAILGSAELGKLSLPPEHPLRESFEQILKATFKANALTRQLLTFARKQASEPRVVNLNKLILDTDKLLRRLIGEDIELVTVPGPDLDRVQIDPGQFEQVLINLAVNARDAMPSGGKLTVETQNVELLSQLHAPHLDLRPGRWVLLKVSDTGTGMSEEVRAHLFEPFFTTKSPERGTGLGLATCYGIVQQAQGQITATSTEGAGSTFWVYLPATALAEDDDAKATGSTAYPRGTETILVVEDEPLVRNFATKVLTQIGYQVVIAATAADALEMVRSQRITPALLLTDVVMPQMGGRQLADALTKLRPELRVLFMSGYADDLLDQRAPSSSGFLAKPFTPKELATRIREVLDLPAEPQNPASKGQ